jgi:NADH dehydrogenase
MLLRVCCDYVEGFRARAPYDIGVEVRLRALVEKISSRRDTQRGGEESRREPIVWAAGNAALPFDHAWHAARQTGGYRRAGPGIPGHRELFVIGDMAHCAPDGGDPLPGLSPVAMQQGRHVAENIRIALAGGWTQPFSYFDKGTMATIGRHAAVADAGFIRFSGYPAWLAWLFVHLIFLVGFRSKIMVLLSGAYAYITYGRGARLITGRQWRGASPRDAT